MRHPLTDEYRDRRTALIELGRSLSESDGEFMTTACPVWSIKDVFAHLAGISTDIVTGNTEGAATPEWADGHVADRRSRTLTEVLDEWERAGVEVTAAMEAFGEAFPFQLFIDQWTHEWDIRAALGPRAEAEPQLTMITHFIDDFARTIEGRAVDAGLDLLAVDVDGHRLDLGTGQPVGDLSLSTFEFARITMGRRSRAQLATLDWPMDDIDGHIDALVVWDVADRDVVDPVPG